MSTITTEASKLNSKPPPLARIFSVVEYSNMRFIILDCPTQDNLYHYLKELNKRGVTDVVRVCDPTYDKDILISNGILVHDWPFKDGGIPPVETLSRFLALCSERFGNISSAQKTPPDETKDIPVIAVHCVAGLGRAPVLVSIALIEAGMTPLDSVDYVRKRRRGAFNSFQLQYLVDNYKRKNSTVSWKMGEAAKAFFGRRSSPPPVVNMNRSESASSERSGESSSSIFSLSKVFKSRKPSSPTSQPSMLI